MMQAYREVRLPADLCRAAEQKFVGAGFRDLETLVSFVLEELVREDALQLDLQEEKIIEERLRGLGYI